jgi:hypothetical protein
LSPITSVKITPQLRRNLAEDVRKKTDPVCGTISSAGPVDFARGFSASASERVPF